MPESKELTMPGETRTWTREDGAFGVGYKQYPVQGVTWMQTCWFVLDRNGRQCAGSYVSESAAREAAEAVVACKRCGSGYLGCSCPEGS